VTPKSLGKGTFGSVFLASNTAHKDLKMAIKTISKKKLTDEMLAKIKDEIKIVQILDHPNIVKYLETFENDKYIYLVMEYLEGGELFDRIDNDPNKVMVESEAVKILKKIFHAVNHCHSYDIIHRDLKMENIMYKSKHLGEDDEVKIIDFGLSTIMSNSKVLMKTPCGSPYYVAPEVMDETGYGKECDIWSLGVITYMLLSGKIPFEGSSMVQIMDNIQNNEVRFDEPIWATISQDAKDLILRCLDKDKTSRITAAEALKCPLFLNQSKIAEYRISDEHIESLKNYKATSVLKKEALSVLVKLINEDLIQDLREVFRSIDTDFTGMISAKELKEAAKSAGRRMSKSEIKQIINN
jgi:calcium-dependent protein kinase